MRLRNIKEKLQRKKQGKIVKRIMPVTWWKLVVGAVLFCPGIFFGYMYINNERLVFFGLGAAIFIASGIFLVYQSFRAREGGFLFKRKYTGRENTLGIFARRDNKTSKDIPVAMTVFEMQHPPKDARLHYVRNWRKHFYELYNNTAIRKLESTKMPDKKPFPPGLFQIPAAMQIYKDAIEYSPPTMLQKIAPGILLLAMGIVGILMVMTTG